MRRALAFLGVLTLAGVVTLTLFAVISILLFPEEPAKPAESGERIVVEINGDIPPEEPERFEISPEDTAELPETPPRIDPGDPDDRTGSVTLDRDPQPIVRIPPRYPIRAAQQGLGGYVTVEFTITMTGEVTDLKVIESSDPIFEQSALNAVARWKYRPAIKNGKPVERKGVRVTIEYKVEPAGIED